MRYLIVIRHADLGLGELSRRGREQLESLCKFLAEQFGDNCKPLILSSPAYRAKRSAEFIARFFGVPLKVHDEVGEYCDYDDAVDFILKVSKDHEVVFVVSHQPQTQNLPIFVVNKLFINRWISCEGQRKGHATLLDCQTGKWKDTDSEREWQSD